MTTARRKLPLWVQNWWLWFAALFAITFAIFWPTFFSALVRIDPPIIVHGISATLWSVLTVVQAILIKTGRRRPHRLLGYSSLALGCVLVLSGIQMVRQMVFREGVDGLGERFLTLKIAYIDMTALALFGLFLTTAIMAARKRDIALHLRSVACTAILPLDAVFERVFKYWMPHLVPDWTTAVYASTITLIVLTGGLCLGEWRYGRQRWPFALLFGYYLFNLVTIDAVARSEWMRIVAFAFAGR